MSDVVDYNQPRRPWTAQPAPLPNDRVSVHETAAVWLLIAGHAELAADLRERGEYGFRKYGTRLQPGNGRRADRDCYEELQDAVAYAEQRLCEERTVAGGVETWESLFWLDVRADLVKIAERVRRKAVQP